MKPIVLGGLLLLMYFSVPPSFARGAKALGPSRQVISVEQRVPPISAAEIHGLSPYWGPDVQQWGGYIDVLANIYGFHPDLIAAIIFHESVTEFQEANNFGGQGLMRLLPTSSVAETALSSGEMLIPSNNLRWGMAILSYVVQQSGGDLFTALAVYHSGWGAVSGQPAREFAAGVLDSYARALIVRAGLSPQMANRWTVAVEIRAGNVPADSVIVLGNRPVGRLRFFAEHVVYAFVDKRGHTHYIRGFVVPVSLSKYVPAGEPGTDDELEPFLKTRLGDKSAHTASGNVNVLLACLLGMERLRGQLTTRWYSPSTCPTLER